MRLIVSTLLMIHISFSNTQYYCGQKETIKRPYGQVELRVNCRGLQEYNSISVLEYKDNVQHGNAVHYTGQWQKKDSCFFVNGKENGVCLFWDSLGNIVGKAPYKDGHEIGKNESYYSPGKPSNITNYNDSGKKDGDVQEWWPNGNKKLVGKCKNGQYLHIEEYFPNGQLRIMSDNKYEPDILRKDPLLNSAVAYSAKGKPTGKVVNGNGEYFMFDDVPDSTTKKYRVLHVIYKNGFEEHNEEISAKAAAKLQK